MANTNTAPLVPNILLQNLGFVEMNPFYPRFWEERLDDSLFITKSLRARLKPRGIFVCDMGELFGDWVPREWQEEIFLTIVNNPQHRFYLLTKQPQNLIKFSPFPENCWVGVTATNTSMAWIASKQLSQIEARVKFLSLEPLLSWETSTPYTTENIVGGLDGSLDWVIIGQQTPVSKKTEPKISWLREIVEAADKAGIPVFLKDNLLEEVNYRSPKTEFAFNKDGYYRQELPVVK